MGCWQARWALSRDEQLQTRGSSTGIAWFQEFEIYLEYLIKGLHQRKASVQRIFKVWDETLFPETISSLAGGKAAQGSRGEDVRAALDALNADNVVDEEEEGAGRAGAEQHSDGQDCNGVATAHSGPAGSTDGYEEDAGTRG